MELISSWCYDGSLPESYVMPPEKRPGDLVVPLEKSIPVIDLQCHDRNETIRQILKAGEEYGFFQIINHGVSKDLMDETMNVAEEFHAMPGLDKERECSKDPNGSCKLYTSSYVYPREDFHLWRDALTHPCRPSDEDIQFWPEQPTRYRQVVGAYSVELWKLSRRILEFICQGLGLSPDYLSNDLSHIISNGKLVGAEHRVVTNSRDARTTVSYFVYPCDESLVGPAQELVDAKNPAIYKAFKFTDFVAAFVLKRDDEAVKELISAPSCY
ncbi:hypothetical protein V6N13_146920 [Hibiscus sabdariffa]|uniref:Non-haem dioxygenase N-terminal domain-containing protein n=1 Tax=Hibiscus sabdariffa TaxID=183260 RepID=A0ABR2TU35_9ROSI